eukprot:6467810-Alexandrium_andersonii.AAC.1
MDTAAVVRTRCPSGESAPPATAAALATTAGAMDTPPLPGGAGNFPGRTCQLQRFRTHPPACATLLRSRGRL